MPPQSPTGRLRSCSAAKGVYALRGAVTSSPLLIQASELSINLDLDGEPGWCGVAPFGLWFVWLPLRNTSCTKRGMIGKQVTRLIVAISARLILSVSLDGKTIDEGDVLKNSPPHSNLSSEVRGVFVVQKLCRIYHATYTRCQCSKRDNQRNMYSQGEDLDISQQASSKDG